MATNAENLATIKSNALATLATISADPKPSYSIGDRTISWTEYQEMLMKQVAWCDAQANADSPAEVISYGI